MKKNILFTIALLAGNSLFADNVNTAVVDTTKVVDIEEVVVIASPKENAKLRQTATASTLLSQKDLQAHQINSMKDLSFYSPNLFIPDYGNKLTAAIYVRGIGSRMGTPAVGMYVDNVPIFDKSAFDFDYSDIERIDVLRGPQGTLYGLNSMGGLIRVYTKSPFDYQGTDLRLGAATYDNYSASVTHYHRINSKLAFSAGGFIKHKGGFFTNIDSSYNKKIDWMNSAGGRLHFIYLPTDKWKIDLNGSYEYVSQGGDPYKNLSLGAISYNDKSSYQRNLVNASLNVAYSADKFTMSSVTGFQYLKDHMYMDNDFMSIDYFRIQQREEQHTFSEELTFKSKAGRRWDWSTGVFGFYQKSYTDAPITFGSYFMNMLQGEMNAAMTGSPVSIKLTDANMEVPGKTRTPNMGAAVFHQSTFHDLFCIKGLSATIGLRADFQRTKLNYYSAAKMNYDEYMNGQKIASDARSAEISGDTAKNYFKILPKFAVQYDFDKNSNIYISASRGYRGGGYNVQSSSDYISAKLEGSTSSTNAQVTVSTIYKPEYTWSYEVGSHLTLLEDRLWADVDVFCMNTRDQQISKINDEGSRDISNAGQSRSYGAELSLRAAINRLALNFNYGYTHSTFTKYSSTETVNNILTTLDYSGNYVPFVPQHTFSLGAEYTIPCKAQSSLIDEIRFGANYNGAANINWDEANSVEQKFYATLNAETTVKMGKVSVCLWGHNLTNKHYNTFYFSDFNTNFAESGAPTQTGIDVRLSF